MCAMNQRSEVHTLPVSLQENLNNLGEAIKAAFMPVNETAQQHWPGTAGNAWQAHASAVAELLTEKQAYGDAWKRQGYMGNLARILSKAARLENMVWRDINDPNIQEDQTESVQDTLLDLSALCALMLANLEEGNRWGR